ncbi:hypothetical protein KUG47_02955 [Falsochrobactrum sp. TDYN1]|uniref:Uncharacterized protein n=1 Tax=Falsochrobactrum tianjinense TaxID=2706015 RepID=A0A949USJ6_9HYPH|nr:hypothetical protein [Falsochrobactrum sp. TDYN1]MBV2142455.1 hypothetical protein [Falsochrobactrum sp. TDYN1]
MPDMTGLPCMPGGLRGFVMGRIAEEIHRAVRLTITEIEIMVIIQDIKPLSDMVGVQLN